MLPKASTDVIAGRLLDRLTEVGGDVIERTRLHKLGPMAHKLGRSGFRDDYIASWAMVDGRRDALVEACGALTAAGIDVALIKGVSYLGWLYDDDCVRPMADIDLLVRPRDHHRSAALLVRLGYRVLEWRGNRSPVHHAMTLQRGRTYIDLHRNIIQPLRARLDIDLLIDQAVPCREGELRALRLTAVDAALIHFAHVGRAELLVPAINYLDGALILSRLSQTESQQLVQRATRAKLRRVIVASLAMTRSLSEAGEWRRSELWMRSLPSPDEVLRGRLPARSIQLIRKLFLCDDQRSAVGLGAGVVLDRWLS